MKSSFYPPVGSALRVRLEGHDQPVAMRDLERFTLVAAEIDFLWVFLVMVELDVRLRRARRAGRALRVVIDGRDLSLEHRGAVVWQFWHGRLCLVLRGSGGRGFVTDALDSRQRRHAVLGGLRLGIFARNNRDADQTDGKKTPGDERPKLRFRSDKSHS